MNTKLSLIALFLSTPLGAEPAALSASIAMTSAGKVGHCEGKVERRVTVCDAVGGCNTLALQDELSFRVPRGGSFIVSATATDAKGHAVLGSAAVDHFGAVATATQLVQSLDAGKRCSYSFEYLVNVR